MENILSNDFKYSIHNKYSLQLYDTKGNLKQSGVAYNVANPSRYMAVGLGGDWPGYMYDIYYTSGSAQRRSGIKQLFLGSGTEPEPSVDDASLIAINGSFTTSLSFTRVNLPKKYGDKVHFTAKVEYPPSSSYVGTITEVGLGNGGYVFSHAWVQDVENNQIVITKTAMDILIITVDVYFSLTLPSNSPNFIRYYPVWGTPIIDTLPGMAGRTVFLSGGYCPPTEGNVCISIPNTSCKMETMTSSSGHLCTNEDGTQSSNISTEITNYAFEPSGNNIGFVHSIVIDRHSIIPLPNSDICPNYSYTDIAVGTGNSNATHFYTPVNQVVSCKIYKNGEEDNTAYMVNADITKSPFWDKCIGVYESKSTSDGTFVNWHSLPEVGGNTPIALSSQLFASNQSYAKFAPCNSAQAPNSSYCSVGAAPVYYDENGIWCDHVYIGYVFGEGYGANLIIQYSNEDITDFLAYDSSWITLTEVSTSATAVYFTRTKAKYWRLKGLFSGSRKARISSIEASWSGSCGWDPCCLILGDSTMYDFGKMGVNFPTAPADGDVITMDAVLNLPYKSPDTKIDFSYEAFINV